MNSVVQLQGPSRRHQLILLEVRHDAIDQYPLWDGSKRHPESSKHRVASSQVILEATHQRARIQRKELDEVGPKCLVTLEGPHLPHE